MVDLEKYDTIGKLEEEIKRIASTEKDPEKLLEHLNTLSHIVPSEKAATIEIRITSVERAPLINALGNSGYKPAAKPIFEYAQKARLRPEITACIRALANLEYGEAIPFIKKNLEDSGWWYQTFRHHGRATGVDLVLENMRVARESLEKLSSC